MRSYGGPCACYNAGARKFEIHTCVSVFNLCEKLILDSFFFLLDIFNNSSFILNISIHGNRLNCLHDLA